jgi:hypothetical protein
VWGHSGRGRRYTKHLLLSFYHYKHNDDRFTKLHVTMLTGADRVAQVDNGGLEGSTSFFDSAEEKHPPKAA